MSIGLSWPRQLATGGRILPCRRIMASMFVEPIIRRLLVLQGCCELSGWMAIVPGPC